MVAGADLHFLLGGKKSLTLNESDLMVHGNSSTSQPSDTDVLCGLGPLIEVVRRSLFGETATKYHALSGDSQCYPFAIDSSPSLWCRIG